MELSIPYSLTHPDGTRVVFGNSDEANADPDWVGYLDPEQGITGLDSPDVRENAADLIQGDGGLHYDFFHGRRPIGFQANIWPVGRTMEQVIALEQKIKRVTNSMRDGEDAILSWANSGFPARQLALRRQQPPRITGRRPKAVTVAMVCADYRILSAVENAPVPTGPGAAGEQTVHNIGDEWATPTFFVLGPIGTAGAPLRIRNMTTGLEIRFKPGYALPAGHLLTVATSPPYPTVIAGPYGGPYGTVMGAIDFLPTTWWGLAPDVDQDVRVEGGGTNGDTLWAPNWRDAWI